MNWRDFFQPSANFRELQGQVDLWQIACDVDIATLNRILAELCTGYGKTLAAYGFYWILKRRGIVNRMLVLAPRDDQRWQ